MIDEVYITKFKEMVNLAINSETNIANIYVLEQISDIHFTTAYSHLEIVKALEHCMLNCNNKCMNIYEALLLGIKMEIVILTTLN